MPEPLDLFPLVVVRVDEPCLSSCEFRCAFDGVLELGFVYHWLNFF